MPLDLSAALSATLQFHGQNRNEWLGRRFAEVGRRTGESLCLQGLRGICHRSATRLKGLLTLC